MSHTRTLSREATGAALRRCTGDTAGFLANVWTKQPFHYAGDGSSGFADLLSLADVDRLLSTTLPRLPSFRLVRYGKPLDRSSYTRKAGLGSEVLDDVGDTGRIFDEFHKGATIVLQGLQRYWTPLADFCRDLELTLTHPVQANAYITPPHQHGLGIHYDTHDVFVLQTAGSKAWEIHQCAFPYPLSTQHARPYGAVHPAMLSLRLRAGEALYVPRGFLHRAASVDEVSVHITIGVLAYTWCDLIQDIAAQVQEDPRFREALPPGFAHDAAASGPALDERIAMLREWLASVDSGSALARLGRKFWSSRTPSLTGQLQQLSALGEIQDNSIIRLRDSCTYYMWVDENAGELVIVLGDRDVRMPAFLEPALRFMLERHEFRAADLAEFLDDASRLVLVRRLIREGLFEAVQGPCLAAEAH